MYTYSTTSILVLSYVSFLLLSVQKLQMYEYSCKLTYTVQVYIMYVYSSVWYSILIQVQILHCTVLIILNAATTVTANNQFNDRPKSGGGGTAIYFVYLQKKTGGRGHVPPPPCPTHLPPMTTALLFIGAPLIAEIRYMKYSTSKPLIKLNYFVINFNR